MSDTVNQEEEGGGNISSIRATINSDSYADYHVGAVLPDGLIVSHIMTKSQSFVLFKTAGSDDVRYSYRGVETEKRDAIRKIEGLILKARNIRKGILDPQINNYVSTALQGVFTGSGTKEFESAINPFKEYVDHLKEIPAVLASSPDFQVWISHTGKVNYRYESRFTGIDHAISELGRLGTLASALLPESVEKAFNRRLGAALVAAFQLKQDADVEKIFRPLDDFIQSYTTNSLRIKYLTATSSAAAILLSITYMIHYQRIFQDYIHLSLVPIAGGFLGTFISIFERSKTLCIAEDGSTKLIIFQGTLRVIVGGVFALIAYSFAQSGIAFSIFKDGIANLILLGVAAGFSERLIPDLIQGFSTKTNQSSTPD